LFERHRDYFASRGWCEPDGMVRDLHLLNGKLFPFLHMNEGSISDYIDLQRMMFMLNESYQSKSFSIFGAGTVATSFRKSITDFQLAKTPSVIEGYRDRSQGNIGGVFEKANKVAAE
jgi:hypothetical protein